jgi:hypothetical protein
MHNNMHCAERLQPRRAGMRRQTQIEKHSEQVQQECAVGGQLSAPGSAACRSTTIPSEIRQKAALRKC